MNRELLYRYLETRFTEAGFSPEEIASHTAYYEKRYASMPDREIKAEIERFGGPEQFAEAAVQHRGTFGWESEAEEEAEAEADKRPPLAEQTDTSIAMSKTVVVPKVVDHSSQFPLEAEDTNAVTAQRKRTESKEPAPEERPAAGDATASRTITMQRVEAVAEKLESGSESITEEELAEIERTAETSSVADDSAGKPVLHTPLYFRTYHGDATEEKRKKFKLLFYATSPLWGLLLLLAALLLFGGLACLILLVPIAFLLLVVYVAAGSGVTLVGLIYGISQIFLVLPKGLDEIGIGVMAMGLTLLGGILLNNFTVRLLPFLIRKVMRFLPYAFRFVPELYEYIRGEVYRK